MSEVKEKREEVRAVYAEAASNVRLNLQMAEASGDKGTAKRLFQELKEEHPANPSSQAHLERLP